MVCAVKWSDDGLNLCMYPLAILTNPVPPRLFVWSAAVCKQQGSIYEQYDVVAHIDSCFLQMFLWEQFFALAQNQWSFQTW